MRLNKKVVLLTGAARGVGLATAKRFSQEGATVVMTDINAELLQREAEAINSHWFVHDVADPMHWQSIVAELRETYGHLHVLFNNAAILTSASVDNETLDNWHRVMQINADSVFLGIQNCLSLLEQEGGSIINMSSSSALMGMPQFCAYTAAKSAVRSLTMSTAVLCKQKGNKVRCNSIHPDGINTDMVREMAMQLSDVQRQDYSRSIPFVCQPEDVANLALFLASDESKHINGAALSIDNTATIHPPY